MMELRKLLDSIIEKGYPELLNYDIQIEYKSLEDALVESGRLSPEGHYIEVDTTVRDAKDEVKVGLIASDLSHIVQDIEDSLWMRLKEGLLYKISLKYRTLDERNTDLITILRGFGDELYEAMKFANEKGFPYYREDGLSLRELKIILNLK